MGAMVINKDPDGFRIMHTEVFHLGMYCLQRQNRSSLTISGKEIESFGNYNRDPSLYSDPF